MRQPLLIASIVIGIVAALLAAKPLAEEESYVGLRALMSGSGDDKQTS